MENRDKVYFMLGISFSAHTLKELNEHKCANRLNNVLNALEDKSDAEYTKAEIEQMMDEAITFIEDILGRPHLA